MSELPIQPVASGLSDASAAVRAAASRATWALSDEQAVARVGDAVRLRAQADAVLLAAIGEVDARGLARAWRDIDDSLATGRPSGRSRSGGEAGRDGSRVARTSAGHRGCDGPAAGVQLGQAQVIVHALADLPKDFPAEGRTDAEATMIGHCDTFGPVPLSFIGRRPEEILDPEGVQARDEKKALEEKKGLRQARPDTLR